MSVYKRGKNKKWSVYVATRSGGRCPRATGTSDRATAKAMDEMLKYMVNRRDWEFIDAIHAEKLSVAELFDAYSCNGLPTLREQMKDVDLQPFIEPWQSEVKSNTSET